MTTTPEILTCPDCTATAPPDVLLQHDATCPLGRGAELTCADDADWFGAHPGSTWFWREPTAAERAEAAIGGVVFPTGTRCQVLDGGRGVLVRVFSHRRRPLLMIHSVPPVDGWRAA